PAEAVRPPRGFRAVSAPSAGSCRDSPDEPPDSATSKKRAADRSPALASSTAPASAQARWFSGAAQEPPGQGEPPAPSPARRRTRTPNSPTPAPTALASSISYCAPSVDIYH